MACTEQEIEYDIFNLGESQTVRLDQLINLLSKALGKEAIIDRKPLQSGDVPITYADISKSSDRLGYDPQVKIDEGIKRFVEWFLRSTAE
jgi:UDP-glucuronate 4-epimerase